MNKLKKNLEEYLESDCGDGMLLLIGKDEAELILKVFEALDKACAILEEGYGEEYATYEYFPDADTMEKIPMRMDACKWKEWLLND